MCSFLLLFGFLTVWTALGSACASLLSLNGYLCREVALQKQIFRSPGMISVLGCIRFYDLSYDCCCLDVALGGVQSHCCSVFQVTFPCQSFSVPVKQANVAVCGEVSLVFPANCSWYEGDSYFNFWLPFCESLRSETFCAVSFSAQTATSFLCINILLHA